MKKVKNNNKNVKKDTSKKNKKKTILTFIIYLILFCILIYSGMKIYNWYKENNTNKDIVDKINSSIAIENNNKYIVDFKSLKEQNSETVAWIKVNDTKVEYPIVKTQNNDFYLTHSFDKSDNSAGWIFADYRNKFDGTDKNIIVYGHNRRDDSMFGSLKKALNSSWYDNQENTDIIFKTENENCIYKVFSVYQIESEDYYIQTEFADETKFKEFEETIKKRSIKDFGIDVSEKDSILTLSTCANNNKYRVVIHAKKTLEGE